MAPWSRLLLNVGYPAIWRHKREENVRQLLDRMPTSNHVHALFDTWPNGNCPFNGVLITDTIKRRDDLRRHFIASQIYPAVHWLLPEDAAAEAQDIARRVLTLPVDQRYARDDIDRIATVFREFLDI